jgi:hypothetical protein
MAPIPESFFSREITARTSGTTTTETSHSTDDPGPEPGTGRLIRILPNGKQKILIDSKRGVLVVPTGITFGPDGALYISNIGYGAPPVGAGQILKVELTD